MENSSTKPEFTVEPSLRKTVVSGSFFSPEFEKESEKIQSLMSDITSKMTKQADEKLWSFFEPYLREAGIKGEITNGNYDTTTMRRNRTRIQSNGVCA